MKNEFDAAIDVLTDNRSEVVRIIQQIGLVNLVTVLPSMLRIAKTIVAKRGREPAEVAEEAAQVVYYSGEITERVKAFQRKHGLRPVDGLVGPSTWAKVEELEKAG